MIDERFKMYRKKIHQFMRPYEPGEDMSGVSVRDGETPQIGGMIAVDKNDHSSMWYVEHEFFKHNYEEVE